MKKQKLDLIFIDIDDAFLYHQTVAVANKLFIMYLSKFFDVKFKEKYLYTFPRMIKESFKIKFNNFFKIFYGAKWKYFIPIIKLFGAGVVLFVANTYKNFANSFLSKNKLISSKFMIQFWANTIISLNIDAKDYPIKEKFVKSSLNNQLFNKVKNYPLIAITESFTTGVNVITKILSLKKIYQNEFIVKNGKIIGYKLNIKSGKDKKRIANLYKAKNIGVVIENYDDVLLLDINNLKYVYYKKKLKRFVNINGEIFK